MRPVLLTFLIVLGLGLQTSTAQYSWIGLVGGVTSSNLPSDELETESAIAINYGLTSSVQLSEKYSLRTSVLLNTKGAEFSIPDTVNTFRSGPLTVQTGYVHIASGAQYNYGEDYQVFVNVQPYVGIRLSNENTISSEYIREMTGGINNVDFGLNGGAGVILPVRGSELVFQVDYDLGLSDVFKSDLTSYNRALRGSLGWVFFL